MSAQPQDMGTRRMYMHLIDGRPARFDVRRCEVFFASGHGRNPIPLCASLAELRAQQGRAETMRVQKGYPALRLGYACVQVVGPDDQETDCGGGVSTALPLGIGKGATHAGGESGLPRHDLRHKKAA